MKISEIITESAKQLDELKCWPGYTRVKGVPAGAPGSCKKKTSESEDIEEGTASGDHSLHDWFSKSKSSDGKPGWVQIGGRYAGKPCAKQPGQKTKPKCGSSKMRRSMSDKEENAAARRKRKEDPNPNRSGAAKMVNTKPKKAKNEDTTYTTPQTSRVAPMDTGRLSPGAGVGVATSTVRG